MLALYNSAGPWSMAAVDNHIEDRDMEHRAWRMEAGAWRMEAGAWRLEPGAWRM